MVSHPDPLGAELPRPLLPQRSLEQESQWAGIESGFFGTGSLVTPQASGWASCVTPDLATGSPWSSTGNPHTD